MKTETQEFEACQTQRKTCGKSTEVFSRVVGFFRPVNQWNVGKKEEFSQRKTYVIADYDQY